MNVQKELVQESIISLVLLDNYFLLLWCSSIAFMSSSVRFKRSDNFINSSLSRRSITSSSSIFFNSFSYFCWFLLVKSVKADANIPEGSATVPIPNIIIIEPKNDSSSE